MNCGNLIISLVTTNNNMISIAVLIIFITCSKIREPCVTSMKFWYFVSDFNNINMWFEMQFAHFV